MPAFNLAIDAASSVDVGQADVNNVRTFTALANDAVLNVDDIQAALQAGLDVVVSTGSGGGSAGNIAWRGGADLNFQGLGQHTLALQTDPNDTAQEVDIEASLIDSSFLLGDQLSVQIVAGGSDGAVTLHEINTRGGALSVVSGGAGIKLDADLQTGGGDLTLTGNVLLENNILLDTLAPPPGGNGPMPTPANQAPLGATPAVSTASSAPPGGALSVSGTIDGDGQQEGLMLTTGGGVISLGSDLGGVHHNLQYLEVAGTLVLTADRTITVQKLFALDTGLVDVGAHTLTVATGSLQIGGSDSGGLATLAGTGVVESASTIKIGNKGVVAPGGLKKLGNLQISGDIEFQSGGELLVDLAAVPDLLHVTGTVQLDSGAVLAGGEGLLGVPTAVAVLTADGGLTGTFADTTGPIPLGYDAVTVNYTANAVQIAPVAAGPNQVTGAAPDGTLYTITLSGGGNARLVVLDTNIRLVTTDIVYVPVTRVVTVVVNGELVQQTITDRRPVAREVEVYQFDVVVRHATLANRLAITATPNGGSGMLNIRDLDVDGSLAAITAPSASVRSLQVSGYLQKLNLAGLDQALAIGGTPNQQSALKIRQINGDITSASAIGTLASSQVNGGTITAPTVGAITTTAYTPLHLGGDFNANLVLDAGSQAALALGSADITGGIADSTWDVRGSLGPITVRQQIFRWQLGSPGGLHPRQLGNVQSLDLGEVLDSSVLAAGHISRLSAADWNGSTSEFPSIRARTLGTLRITGTLADDLVLDAGFSSSQALGTATLGNVFDSTWDIQGSIGSVTVTNRATRWNLGKVQFPEIVQPALVFGPLGQVGNIQSLSLGAVNDSFVALSGTLDNLTAASWQGGSVMASTLGALKIKGQWNAALILDAGLSTTRALTSATLGSIAGGSWFIRGSLGSVTVQGAVVNWGLGGQAVVPGAAVNPDQASLMPGPVGNIQSLSLGAVRDSVLILTGTVAKLTAASWQGGSITAGSLGAVKIKGLWSADLSLGAGLTSTQVLDSATLGSISGGTWNVTGAVGTVTIARNGFVDGWTLGTGQLGSINQLVIGGIADGSSINVLGHIGSIRAVAWESTSLNAQSLGQLTITGNAAAGVAGSFSDSTVTLTGASGGVGLGTVQIAGSVQNSNFNVQGGDVTSFTCGRFRSSNLYVGYIPALGGGFNALGTFLGAYTLLAFATTAQPPVPHQSNPRTDAYQDSQIVANRFGHILLTGVTITNAVSFGLRVNGTANAGTVLIGTTPFQPNVPVPPGTIQGAFEFLAS